MFSALIIWFPSHHTFMRKKNAGKLKDEREMLTNIILQQFYFHIYCELLSMPAVVFQ